MQAMMMAKKKALMELISKMRHMEAKEQPADERKESPMHEKMEDSMGMEDHDEMPEVMVEERMGMPEKDSEDAMGHAENYEDEMAEFKRFMKTGMKHKPHVMGSMAIGIAKPKSYGAMKAKK